MPLTCGGAAPPRGSVSADQAQQGRVISSSRGDGGRASKIGTALIRQTLSRLVGAIWSPRRLHILISWEQGSWVREEWLGEEMTKMPVGDRHDGWKSPKNIPKR